MNVEQDEAHILQSVMARLTTQPPERPRTPRPVQTAKWTCPGFLGKTRILTDFGALPIEALRTNDPIVTGVGRVMRVRRIRKIGLDRHVLAQTPDAQPVRIMADAFGPGLPKQDMLLSPAQELTVRIQNFPPRRLRAGEIRGTGAVMRAPATALVYYAFELEEEAVAYAEGISFSVAARSTASTEDDGEDGAF